MARGSPGLPGQLPPCTSDTAHQEGVPGPRHCRSSGYITSALVLASRCPGGGPAVAWPWAVAGGDTGVPTVQLFAPLYSHCGSGKRKVLWMSGAGQRTSPPHTNGESQDLCPVQASEAQNTLLTCTATHCVPSSMPRLQLQRQAGKPGHGPRGSRPSLPTEAPSGKTQGRSRLAAWNPVGRPQRLAALIP